MEMIVRENSTTPPTSPSQSGHSGKSSGNGHNKYEAPNSPSMSGSAWTGVAAAGSAGTGVALDHAGIDVTDDSLMNQHGRISNPTTLSDGDVPVKSSSPSLKKKLLIGGSFVVLAVVAIVLAIELMKHHGNDPAGVNGVDANQAGGGGGPAALQVGSGGSSSSSSSSSTGSVPTASGSASGGGGGGGGGGSSSGSGTTAVAASSTSATPTSSSSSTTGSGSHSSSSTSGSTAAAASSSASPASSSTVTSSSSSASPSSTTVSGSSPSSSSTSAVASSSSSVVSSSSAVPSSSSSTPSSSSSSTGSTVSSSSSSSATPASSSAAASSSTATAASSSSVPSSSTSTPSSSSAMSSSAQSSSSTASAASSSSSVPSSSSSPSASSSSSSAAASSSSVPSSSSATPSSSSAISSSGHSSSSTGAGVSSSSSVPSSSSSSAGAVSSSAASSSSSIPSSSSTAAASSSSAVQSSSSATPSSSSTGGGAASSSTGGSSSSGSASSTAIPSSSTAANAPSSSSSTGASGPAINYVRPGYTWYFNANATATKNGINFLGSMRVDDIVGPYSQSVQGTTSWGDAMVNVSASGNPKAFYLSTLNPHSLPGLQAGSLYRFSMMVQFSNYGWMYTCGNLKFLVYRPNTNTVIFGKESYNSAINFTVNYNTWNVTNQRYPPPTGQVSSAIAAFNFSCTNYTHTAQGRPYAIGEWVTYTSTFNMTTDTADSIVGVYWNPGVQSGKSPSTDYIAFTNFTMTLLPNQTQRAPDAFQDGTSKVAQQPKQSTLPDFTDSTSTTLCPHLWPGLVAWENIISAVNESQPVIILPDNTQILYGANSNPRSIWWQKIVIPVTSTLIFDDVPLVVHFENIMVLGAFRIGSQNCRMQSIQQFFVHDPSLPPGNATGSDPQCYYCQGILSANNGQKGIAAPKPNVAYPFTSSIIELHSYQYTPTWTRLASSVFPGDIVIYVQDANNWEIGQSIVLVTSTWYDEIKPQNEQLVIAAMSSDGKIIQLAKPAQFHHYAGPEYQSEVAILTRRLTFSAYDMDGSASSSRIGGHIMSSGQLRASGVELTKMGQRNILGRYPLHWHNAGNATQYAGQGGQFIQDCSFHSTYFRCLSIHATHSATVTRSVGYDVTAHCFFIEDGIEQNNTISYSLGAYVHAILPTARANGWSNPSQPTGTWPIMPGSGQLGQTVPYGSGLAHASDAAPAPFYITNAYNRFIGNAASGGFTGFSFVGVGQTLGTISFGKYPGYVPRDQPSLQFEGNTAHSSGYMWEEGGGCIYAGGDLQYNNTLIGSNGQPGDFWYTNGRMSHGPFSLNHTKVWLCMKGASHWGQNVYNAQPILTNWESHDTMTSAALFYGKVDHAYVNGHSKNPSYQQIAQRGFLSYDKISYLMLTNIEFANFNSYPYTDWPMLYVFSSMANFNNYVTEPLDAISKFSFTNCDTKKLIFVVNPMDPVNNNTIYSTSTRIEIAGAYTFTRIDYDGSLSSYGTNTWLANNNRSTKVQTVNLLQPNVLNTVDTTWPAGRGAIIGAANNMTSWWHYDNTCMLNDNWMVYICNLTYARRPITVVWSTQRWLYPQTLEPTSAALFTLYDRFATGHPDPDFGLRFGDLALFGPGLTLPDRTQPVWNVFQVTGLSGIGWWWNFNLLGGSPYKMVIEPTYMYNNSYVIMAMPYPSGTNCTVEWRYGWFMPWTRVMSVPHYNNYTSLVTNTTSNQPGWTFDGSNLFVKMIAFPLDLTNGTTGPGPTELYLDELILPGGVVQSRHVYYQWNCTCTGVTSRGICPVANPTYPIVNQI